MKTTDQDCEGQDIALKSLFLGPQSENAQFFETRVEEVLSHVVQWRKGIFPKDGSSISVADQATPEFVELRKSLDRGLAELLRRLESETPKFTPRYIGHMVSEISLPALLAEFALLLHNPNNASHEAARVGLVIEKEAIADLATMLGFDPRVSRGHFTSCGTIANFEALWRATYWFDRKFSLALSLIERGHRSDEELFDLCHVSRSRYVELLTESGVSEEHLVKYSLLRNGPWKNPANSILKFGFEGPVILVPGNRHYSWPKASALLGFGTASIWTVDLDSNGRLDVGDLEKKIRRAKSERRPILALVSVAGTTELGEIDPVADVRKVLEKFETEDHLFFWHHIDAAFGGYFTSLKGARSAPVSDEVMRSLEAIGSADSITIDPHKLGYVPYACGAFIARSLESYESFQVRAPYLKAEESALAGWTTTLEGSRSAAGAAAVWLTARTLPLNHEGFGRILEKTIEARLAFASSLETIPGVHLVSPLDTNVLCFAVSRAHDTIAASNEKTLALFAQIEQGPHFSVSRTTLLRAHYSKMIARLCREWSLVDDGVSDLSVVRLVLMNPFIVSKEMKTDFAAVFAAEIGLLLEGRCE